MILTVTMNPAIDKVYFVDGFKIDNVHRPTKMIASAGGKGLNVARVAKLLGEEVAATGFLGGGNGQFIRKEIKKLGLIDQFVEIEGDTRICINITDIHERTCSEVLEAGPTITKKQSELFQDMFENMLTDVDVVTISGSLPKGMDNTFYQTLIELCHMNDVKVLLDTSGISFKNGIKAIPYGVKPNDEEIKSITEGSLIEALSYFKKEGITMPMISLGKDGSLVGLKDGIYKVSFPKIQVVNTVGSGDSFIAGCAVGLSRKLDDIDVIKLATACGSANTQYEQTGFVEQEIVDKFIKQVQIEKVSEYI